MDKRKAARILEGFFYFFSIFLLAIGHTDYAIFALLLSISILIDTK